jgi:hypothetical protein
MKAGPSIANIPNALAATGLSNIGFAVLWYNLGDFNGFLPSVVWLICLHAALGVLMQSTFLLRAFWYPFETARDLLSHPSNITTIGTISIAMALVGKLLALFESMGLPAVDIKVSTSVVILATVISLSAIIVFIPLCFLTKTYPEPFFCVVIYSILFVVVSFPGHNQLVRATKDAVFIIGLALAPAMLVMIPRAVLPREKDEDVVANNPSVCIMQAGPGILCTAWLTSPLGVQSASSGAGAVVSHCFFGLSTLSFLSVLLCLHQRRKVLATIGVHPQWAPLSFPFINSAIASGVYGQMFPSPFIKVWCFLLTGIAITNHTVVNFMYLSRCFFLCDNYGIKNRIIYCQHEHVHEEEEGGGGGEGSSHAQEESAGCAESTQELSSMSSRSPAARI